MFLTPGNRTEMIITRFSTTGRANLFVFEFLRILSFRPIGQILRMSFLVPMSDKRPYHIERRRIVCCLNMKIRLTSQPCPIDHFC